jgi:REP element-mobilizing transposase RayT
MNRALARRPYFETRSDKRYFLARLASEVRTGSLEVHAYCLMTTHFHLLVRSPRGELSNAMRRVQNAYSRHFNRRRRRDGPLIRARFLSKRVDSELYRQAVVRYIDLNPVRAGLVRGAEEHEFGSARAFVTGPARPWLSSCWIEALAAEVLGEHTLSTAAYRRLFGPRSVERDDAVVELVEARMRSSSEVDALDDLIGRAPAEVRRWMRAKARLADGHPLGLPVCGPSCVARAIRGHIDTEGEWLVEGERRSWRGSVVAHVGLLRDLTASSLDGIGRMLELRIGAVRRRAELHREQLLGDEEYGERVARIARHALELAT